MQIKEYAEFAVSQTQRLLAADSPTGFPFAAQDALTAEFAAIGCEAKKTVKGGILVDLGGKNKDDGLLLQAHIDTLGAMVAEIKGSGRLRHRGIRPLAAGHRMAGHRRLRGG